MLKADKVSVSYGNRPILNQVDFVAEPGKLTCIVGPNGSGKTTLLKAITGEVTYTGEVILNGMNIKTAAAWKLADTRGVLAQKINLAFPFTVGEVVKLGLTAGTETDGTLVTQALNRVGLAGYGARFYQELSGGEQQRAQLARVLLQVWDPKPAHGPRWLFLDEPVSSLDIGHQLLVMQIAKDFAAKGGGVVAVMHDLNLTALFSDSVALMSEQGGIVAQGQPRNVLRNDHLSAAYQCDLKVNVAPQSGTFLLPHAASIAAA